MIVISDTTPIISLLKAEQLELLKYLFGEVVIPEAVYEELIVKSDVSTGNRENKTLLFHQSEAGGRFEVCQYFSQGDRTGCWRK